MTPPDEQAEQPPPDQGYEYRGWLARSWDLLRGDASEWPDRAFWRQIIQARGGPSLDVGCGTGRLLLDYLSDGLDVDGVDNSPEMLELCRQRAAELGLDVQGRLFHQEMERLALPRRYSTIFVPSLSFMLLVTPAAAARAMSAFCEHLEPGGLLVLSLSSKLWRGRVKPLQGEWSDWLMAAEHPRGDGSTIRRWIKSMYDHNGQLEHEQNRFEVIRDGVVTESEHHHRSPCVRWYSVAQARALFEAAGFESIQATEADGFDPAAEDSRRYKMLGTRPG